MFGLTRRADAAPPGATPAPARSLTSVTVSGIAWLVMQNVGGRGIGLVSQLVTASLLLPSDYGLIGLTYTVSAVGGLLVSFGVDSVLLQRRSKIHLWVGPAFWWTFALGLLGFLLVLVISPFAAALYHAPGLPFLAAIIAISTPLTALQTVPLALLRSRLAFRTIATVNLMEIFGIQGLTILLAFLGFGALSFAIPLPTVSLLKSLFLLRLTRPNLRGGIRRLWQFRRLFRDSASVFGTNMIQSAISQGDNVTLGLLSTDIAVGTYYFAFRMASQPMVLMAGSLTGVLFPALTRLRDRPREQGAGAIRAAKLVGLIVMPTAFLQAAVTMPVIHVFFRSKWDASIPLMQILSIGLGFDAITWVASALLTSRGGFRTQLFYSALCVPVFFGMVVTGTISASATGTAVAVAAYYLLISPAFTLIVLRRDGLTTGRLATIYLAPALLAAISTGAALLLNQGLGLSSNILQIAVIGGSGSLVYVGLLRLFDPGGLAELRTLALGLAKR